MNRGRYHTARSRNKNVTLQLDYSNTSNWSECVFENFDQLLSYLVPVHLQYHARPKRAKLRPARRRKIHAPCLAVLDRVVVIVIDSFVVDRWQRQHLASDHIAVELR